MTAFTKFCSSKFFEARFLMGLYNTNPKLLYVERFCYLESDYGVSVRGYSFLCSLPIKQISSFIFMICCCRTIPLLLVQIFWCIVHSDVDTFQRCLILGLR